MCLPFRGWFGREEREQSSRSEPPQNQRPSARPAHEKAAGTDQESPSKVMDEQLPGSNMIHPAMNGGEEYSNINPPVVINQVYSTANAKRDVDRRNKEAADQAAASKQKTTGGSKVDPKIEGSDEQLHQSKITEEYSNINPPVVSQVNSTAKAKKDGDSRNKEAADQAASSKQKTTGGSKVDDPKIADSDEQLRPSKITEEFSS